MKERAEVATFWHGPTISALELACLMSFANNGFLVSVFSYSRIDRLPFGLRRENASEIVDASYLTKFIVSGKPSLSHFSDYFRYKLFSKTDFAWIDTDLLCLRSFNIPNIGHFLTRETETRLNGAILRLARGRDLEQILEQTEFFAMGKGFEWGSTGPALMTKQIGQETIQSRSADPERFYPISWHDWWKPFLRRERERCGALVSNADTLHLWNNIVEKSGYWKELAPPSGSYLHEQLATQDLLALFREVLPENVMSAIATNYERLQDAGTIPFKRLARIAAQRAWTRLKAKNMT